MMERSLLQNIQHKQRRRLSNINIYLFSSLHAEMISGLSMYSTGIPCFFRISVPSQITNLSGSLQQQMTLDILAAMIREVHVLFPDKRVLHGSIVVIRMQPSANPLDASSKVLRSE